MAHGHAERVVRIVLGIAILGAPALAQTDNICSLGEAPDLIVGDIFGDGGPHGVVGRYWGTVGGISAYSFGTDACNFGTCQADWFPNSPSHPVIGQNLFRLKDGRFEHIGQSWLKHGFASENATVCSTSCLTTDGQHLGVNCSDGYTAARNGQQREMGPKSDVQARTGQFPWPPTDLDLTGDVIYKRLQVHDVDLDPELNAGALYFVEAQYVARDDALGQNQNNNASYRAASVSPDPGGGFSITLNGPTQQESAAIHAWQGADPAVSITPLESTGHYLVGVRVTDLGDGSWHYEYAIQNLNSDGAAGFSVPINSGATVTNIGFHDVDYHSGEPYDDTDWPGVFDPDRGEVTWSVVTLDDFANALRWGTLYNFRFDCDVPPVQGTAVVRPYFVEASLLFESVPGEVQTWVPRICDDDGICEKPEDCNNCPGDCSGTATITFCGDGICNPMSGEDCASCSQDCNGQQGGSPGTRFCCGDGDGQGPVDCTDLRCVASGFACATPCCGDGICNFGEDACACAPDCGLPAEVELICQDGLDDDCDGLVDCTDRDCCLMPGCADGIDDDGDSVADCDCDDTNPDVWDFPGEARSVTLMHDRASGETTLSWVEPLDPGATSVTYAVLRSARRTDFGTAAVCLALADPQQSTAIDSEQPATDGAFHYLVRAENGCPAAMGLGALGTGSGGWEREGRTCP